MVYIIKEIILRSRPVSVSLSFWRRHTIPILRFCREVVKLLLQHEASTNIVDAKGSSPLHLAAWSGNSEIVRLILSQGPSVPDVNLTVIELVILKKRMAVLLYYWKAIITGAKGRINVDNKIQFKNNCAS